MPVPDAIKILSSLPSFPSRADLWTDVVQRLGVRNMLELGVWRGEFAEILLSRVAGLSRYYLLDPWQHLDEWNKPFNVDQAQFDEVFEEARSRTDFAADKRVFLKGRTTDVIDQIEDGSLDLAYVDGDHTLRGISIDLIAAWPKVRSGGVLAGDDFSASIWQHDESFEPSLVFPFAVHFAEAQGATIVALQHSQFAIVKPQDGERNFQLIDPTNTYGETSLRPQVSRRRNTT